MNGYPLIPWFFKYNFIFLIVFFLVTALVSFFALKAHKISGQKAPKIFGLAFFVMAMGYFLRLIYQVFQFESVGFCRECLRGVARFSPWTPIIEIFHFGFLLMGILLLVYLSLRVKNKKILPLLIGLVFIALLNIPKPIGFFVLLSTFLYLFLVNFYYKNYKQKKQKETLIVLISFSLLFLSQILMFGLILSRNFFIISRFIELAGFIGILINLILISKR